MRSTNESWRSQILLKCPENNEILEEYLNDEAVIMQEEDDEEAVQILNKRCELKNQEEKDRILQVIRLVEQTEKQISNLKENYFAALDHSNSQKKAKFTEIKTKMTDLKQSFSKLTKPLIESQGLLSISQTQGK